MEKALANRRSITSTGWRYMLLFLLLAACTEVIDLKVDSSEEMLIVDGRLTDGAFGNEVSLATTSALNSNQSPLREARISLLEDGAKIADYREVEPGKYHLIYPNDSAREGRSYQLQILLPNGKEYRSRPSIMPQTSVKDHLRVETGIFPLQIGEEGIEEDRRMARLFAESDVLNADNDFYVRWDVYETWMLEERLRIVPPGTPPPVPCYITNNITGPAIRLYNGADLKANQLPEELFAFSEIDMRFSLQYFFHVVNSTFDQEAYQYFLRVEELANLQGSIFDKPPAPIPGNIISMDDANEEVLGYFQVVNTDTSRIKINAHELPFIVPKPCPDWNRFREPSFCTDCLEVENSTKAKPYYWY